MRSSISLPTRWATSSTRAFSINPWGLWVPCSCPPWPASITMRPTLSPSARVNELPPLEVRLAALLNSPGKGAGGADAVGTGGSALREDCCPAARGCGGTSNGWVGSDSTGAGGDLASAGDDFDGVTDLAGGDLATTGGAILGVTDCVSALGFRAGASGPAFAGGGSAAP